MEEDGDRLLGHLSFQRTDTSRARPQWGAELRVPMDRLAVVSRFFVAPDARGRGIGSALSADPWTLDVLLFVLPEEPA